MTVTIWKSYMWTADKDVNMVDDGRAPHRYRGSHGFKSHTGLNFFKALFSLLLKWCSLLRRSLSHWHFPSSCDVNLLFGDDIVRINEMLVTLRGERVKEGGIGIIGFAVLAIFKIIFSVFVPRKLPFFGFCAKKTSVFRFLCGSLRFADFPFLSTWFRYS